MAESSSNPIYLDHNATTPVFPEVVEAMRACWSEPYLNPASQHEFGRRARRVLEDARERIAELLGADPTDRVVFTSGGTEANNLAIRGLVERAGASSPPMCANSHLIISAIEHPSITSLADQLSRHGWHIDRLRVDRSGVIRIDDLPRLLQPETRLVAAMFANNETGVIQPVAELAAICNERGVPLHTDAAQIAGKLPVKFHELGAATMSIAAHKFGGPLGIGALVVRNEIRLSPLMFGGVQQAGMRPGTESVALAAGMRRALELWEANRRQWLDHLGSLRNRFEQAIRHAAVGDKSQPGNGHPILIGEGAPRLPNTSNIAFPGLDRQQLFLALDQAGVACSTGSACASGSSEASPVHIAMDCDRGVISSALRFSLGVQTTREGVEEAARRIIGICNNLRKQKLA